MSLDIIVGCMFSGKSTELKRRVNRFRSIGKRVLVVNHQLDNRYSDKQVVVTHSGESLDAIKTSDLKWIVPINHDVVAIDEAQMFPGLYDRVMFFVEKMNLTVIVAGLTGDYRRENFGELYRLYSVASDIYHCKALCGICKNGTPGIFTFRTSEESEQLLVGSTDLYVSVCRPCYLELNQN
jgi:thymidine kinase